MRSSTLAIIPLFGLCLLPVAEAHITLTSPSPRTSSQKVGPCGSGDSVRGPAQTYQPGETITVEWDETVDHVGHYRIAFDTDGNDDFPLPNNPDDDFPSILVDQIEDRSGGGLYSQEVTLPDMECDNCTLQLIQVMTTSVPYNSFYFQCADITLSNGAPGSPDAGGGGDGDGDGGSTEPTSGGCSSSGGTTGASALLLAGLGLGLVLRRRQRARLCRARVRRR